MVVIGYLMYNRSMKKEPLLKGMFVQKRIVEFPFREGWGRKPEKPPQIQAASDRTSVRGFLTCIVAEHKIAPSLRI